MVVQDSAINEWKLTTKGKMTNNLMNNIHPCPNIDMGSSSIIVQSQPPFHLRLHPQTILIGQPSPTLFGKCRHDGNWIHSIALHQGLQVARVGRLLFLLRLVRLVGLVFIRSHDVVVVSMMDDSKCHLGPNAMRPYHLHDNDVFDLGSG